jgi:hypothetical protein
MVSHKNSTFTDSRRCKLVCGSGISVQNGPRRSTRVLQEAEHWILCSVR